MRLTLIIFLCLFHLISYCNAIRNLPDKDYGISWYTDSDGLPQNSVKQIFRDTYGFIWLLTQNGLVRYDGRNFRVFNSENTSIHSNRMTYAEGSPGKDSIFVYNDFDEALLISGRTAKTFHEKTRSLHFYQPDFSEKDLPDSVRTAGIEGIIHNNIARQSFVYTENKLYFLQKGDSGLHLQCILTDFDFSPENSILSVYYDPYLKHIYMGSATRGMGIVKKYDFRSINTPGTVRVQYALVGYGADEALTASGAIIDVSSCSGKKLNTSWKSDRYSIIIDDEGDIWTKDHNLLYRYRKETDYQEYEHWTLPQKIEQLYKGPDNRIWIAVHLGDENTVASKGLLYYLDPSEPDHRPKRYKTLDFSVCYMLQTTDNTLWLGSFKGLYKMDLHSGNTSQVTGLYAKHIKSLYAPEPQEIWITTSTNGIFLYKEGTLTGFPTDRKGYMLSSHCIVEDEEGYLWITTGKGLFQVSKRKMLEYASGRMKQVYYHYYNKNSGFLSNEFNGSCEPCGIRLDDGHLALPSLNGIVVFDPKKVKPNLPNNTIYLDEVRMGDHILPVHRDTAILRRDFGRVHIRLATPYFDNPDNLNMEFKLEEENSKSWEYIEDGQTITFSQLPPGKHTLIVRKMNSFYSHYIHKRIMLIVPPYFWETDWFYALLFLSIPVMVFYSIKLRIKYVRYKNALLKKKILESTRHLRNTISTLRVTKDKLKQQTGIQEKLIASISHDIRSPLRFMVDTGEYLYVNYDTGNKKMIREGIRSMYNASVKIHEFISELLDYSKARIYEGRQNTPQESHDLQRLVEEKISLFTEIANSQRTGIFNYVPYRFATTVNKHLLSIVIHNLLDNAVKNTHNGKIILYAFRKEKELYIVIEDTGRGIPAKQLRYYRSLINPDMEEKDGEVTVGNSLGIKIILDLLIILNGKIDIKSTVNRGTRVTLTFP